MMEDNPQLSQDELDALLKAVSERVEVETVEASVGGPKQVSDYDFARPERFSQERLRVLKRIHDAWARLVTSDAAVSLAVPIQIQTVEVHETSFEDFMDVGSEQDVVAMIEAEGWDGKCMIRLGEALALTLVDRILGGMGRDLVGKRELTSIDDALLSKAIGQLVSSYESTWRGLVDISPDFRLTSVHAAGEVVPIFTPGEVVATIRHEMSIGEVKGRCVICLPYGTLEPILPGLSPRQWFQQVSVNGHSESRDFVERRLEETLLRLRVVLGKAFVTVNDLMSLSRGDTIILDQRVKEPLTIMLEDRPMFLAYPGRCGRWLAIKLKAWMNSPASSGDGKKA